MTITIEQKLAFYHSMLRIRKTEEYIDTQYLNDQMRTPVHLYIGQEAIATGVCSALSKQDYIQSNHRSHGHYLAKGGNLKAMIAELFCKETGCSGGFGGSMHLIDKSVGHLGSSAIVAGGISIGTGLGLAIKLKNNIANQVSVVFLGDGAAESGVFYESVCFAMLKKLPVIYILENNLLSVCSHISKRQCSDNIFLTGTTQETLFTKKIDGNNPETVFNATSEAVARAKNNLGPSLIECSTYRVSGHAGCSKQDAVGYRDSEEEQAWLAKCPIKLYKEYLINNNIADIKILEIIEQKIIKELDEAFEYAQNSPLPSSKNLGQYLFSE